MTQPFQGPTAHLQGVSEITALLRHIRQKLQALRGLLRRGLRIVDDGIQSTRGLGHHVATLHSHRVVAYQLATQVPIAGRFESEQRLAQQLFAMLGPATSVLIVDPQHIEHRGSLFRVVPILKVHERLAALEHIAHSHRLLRRSRLRDQHIEEFRHCLAARRHREGTISLGRGRVSFKERDGRGCQCGDQCDSASCNRDFVTGDELAGPVPTRACSRRHWFAAEVVLDVLPESVHRHIALAGAALSRLLNDRLQVGIQSPGRRVAPTLSGQQLSQQHSQGVDIGGCRYPLAGHLLR